MSNRTHTIHPLEDAPRLESVFRKIAHNPQRILKKYIREGMTVVDFGCGPGFFTTEMANLTGKNGKVIAVDIQKGMLDLLEQKIRDTGFESRITLLQHLPQSIDLYGNVDFILAFYAIHEVPDKEHLLQELASLLKPNGQMLVAEQKGHVTKNEFRTITNAALKAGLTIMRKPNIFISRALLLIKN